jgi:hypothetical protein
MLLGLGVDYLARVCGLMTCKQVKNQIKYDLT